MRSRQERVDRRIAHDRAQAAEQAPPNPTTAAAPGGMPDSIGPNRILEAPGEGGMGTVYTGGAARPVRRLVVLEVVQQGLATKDVLARFEVADDRAMRPDRAMIVSICARVLVVALCLMALWTARPADQATTEPGGTSQGRATATSDLRVRIRRAGTRSHAAVRKSVARGAMLRFTIIANTLIILSFSGFLLLLAPAFLHRRYPGQLKRLIGWSGLAATAFVLSMLLLAGLLVLFQAVQTAFNQMASPVLQITQGGFEALQRHIAERGATHTELVEESMHLLENGTTHSVPVALLQNAASLQSDLRVFESLARTFSWVEEVAGLLPTFVAAVVVFLFLLSMRQTALALARLPQAVLSNETTARETLRTVGRTLWAELLSTIVLIALFLGVACVAAIVTMQSVRPAVDAVVGYTLLSGSYALAEPRASTVLIYTSVSSAMLLLLLSVATTLVASVLYLSRIRRVLRARLVERRKSDAGWRVFVRTTAAVLWALVVPLLLVHAVAWLSDRIIASQPAEGGWFLVLGTAPLIFVAGFFAGYWLLRGVDALRFLRRD